MIRIGSSSPFFSGLRLLTWRVIPSFGLISTMSRFGEVSFFSAGLRSGSLNSMTIRVDFSFSFLPVRI
ncbi:hypothetical protein D3C74_449470 [compost metagenome]